MMRLYEIPEGAEMIATGLYVYRYQITVSGVVKTLGKLYSTEGYCFYDVEAEVYDEEGNIIPEDQILPNQRLYMQYCTLPVILASKTNEELAARFISVPVDDSYEIVSVGNDHETASVETSTEEN